jgi:hypothetical protein
MDVLKDSHHPIYNPEHFYSKMEFNKTMTKVRDAEGWKVPHFSRDIHFANQPEHYQTLVEACVAIVRATQFMGNLIDVAAAENTAFPG